MKRKNENTETAGAPEGGSNIFTQVALPGPDGAVQHRAGPEADPSETIETVTEVIP